MRNWGRGEGSCEEVAAFFLKGSIIYTEWSASSSVWMALIGTIFFLPPKDKILRSLTY